MVNATPRSLYPQEINLLYRRLVGPRAGLEGRGKSRPPLAFDPRTFQPVANCYADYFIPAHVLLSSHL